MDMEVSTVEFPSSLKRIGVESIEQALVIAPVSFRDCVTPITVLPVPDTGISVFICLTVVDIAFQSGSKENVTPSSRKLQRVKGVVMDELGYEAYFIAYQNLDLWRGIGPGMKVFLYGQYTTYSSNMRSFYDPVAIHPDDVGRVIPVYKGKQGVVSAESIYEGVQAAKPFVVAGGDHLLEKTGLSARFFKDACGLTPHQLLANMHWPETLHQATLAMAAAREVSIRAVQEQVRRTREREVMPSSALGVTLEEGVERVKELLTRFPFPLTVDQKRAIWQILQDLVSEYPMRRMLSGDVGTGKTATFFVPAVLAHSLGWPVAIIAPNRLLVSQIASELVTYFPEVPVTQVVSGVRLAEDAFEQHSIFIGTTALVMAAENAGRKFKLLISDEQQKFSVDQRKALVAEDGNVLESTATAIPRTVALVAMGGLDVSELKTCPVDKDIKSWIVRKDKVRGLFGFIKEQIQAGGQVAVIYPLAEKMPGKKAQGGLDPTRSVEAALSRFAEHFGDRVGLIHGKLKASQKTQTIERMNNKEIDVLISSTVIEIGLTLPSLRVVVVVNPERFGVSQLHQMRGRLARKGGKGYFFMLDLDNALVEGSDALERMQLLESTTDGFELALRDAEMRGAGEVFSDYGEQSGATKGIFYGIELTYNDIERAALEAAYQGGRDILPVAISDA